MRLAADSPFELPIHQVEGLGVFLVEMGRYSKAGVPVFVLNRVTALSVFGRELHFDTLVVEVWKQHPLALHHEVVLGGLRLACRWLGANGRQDCQRACGGTRESGPDQGMKMSGLEAHRRFSRCWVNGLVLGQYAASVSQI